MKLTGVNNYSTNYSQQIKKQAVQSQPKQELQLQPSQPSFSGGKGRLAALALAAVCGLSGLGGYATAAMRTSNEIKTSQNAFSNFAASDTVLNVETKDFATILSKEFDNIDTLHSLGKMRFSADYRPQDLDKIFYDKQSIEGFLEKSPEDPNVLVGEVHVAETPEKAAYYGDKYHIRIESTGGDGFLGKKTEITLTQEGGEPRTYTYTQKPGGKGVILDDRGNVLVKGDAPAGKDNAKAAAAGVAGVVLAIVGLLQGGGKPKREKVVPAGLPEKIDFGDEPKGKKRVEEPEIIILGDDDIELVDDGADAIDKDGDTTKKDDDEDSIL